MKARFYAQYGDTYLELQIDPFNSTGRVATEEDKVEYSDAWSKFIEPVPTPEPEKPADEAPKSDRVAELEAELARLKADKSRRSRAKPKE